MAIIPLQYWTVNRLTDGCDTNCILPTLNTQVRISSSNIFLLDFIWHCNWAELKWAVHISRSNPLYKEHETDYYEVMSLSSGYFSTFRRDPRDGEIKKTGEVMLTFGVFQVSGQVIVTWRGAMRIRRTILLPTRRGCPPWIASPWKTWLLTRATPPRQPPIPTGTFSRGSVEKKASLAPTDPPFTEEALLTLTLRLKVRNVQWLMRISINFFKDWWELTKKPLPPWSANSFVFSFLFCFLYSLL